MSRLFHIRLRFLIATPKRALFLVPLVLAGSYGVGFMASASLILSHQAPGRPSALQAVPWSVETKLLSLVPDAYAIAHSPKSCTGTCDALVPANYSTTSDFYANNAGGVDFEFRVPGDPSVGYINVDSLHQTVTKRFD